VASALYPTGKKKAVDNDLDIQGGAAIKNMLVQSTYTYVATHEFIDNAGANDPVDEECSATGYTGGFAGADRLVPASRTTTVNGAIVEFKFTSPVWSSIGNGTNQTVGGVILVNEVTNDTLSPVICFDELVGNVTTNGGDLTYNPNDIANDKMLDW
jgi:hypothetical protein